MLNRKLFFGLLLIAIVASAFARAFVVQEYKDATSYGNAVRAPAIDKKAEDKKAKSKSTAPDKILPKTSSKFLKSQTEKTYVVNLNDVKTKSLVVPIGYSIFFSLTEEDDADWKADDSNSNFFRLVNSSKKDDLRVFEFKSLKSGDSKIYFDKIINGASVKSVIVKVKVD